MPKLICQSPHSIDTLDQPEVEYEIDEGKYIIILSVKIRGNKTILTEEDEEHFKEEIADHLDKEYMRHGP